MRMRDLGVRVGESRVLLHSQPATKQEDSNCDEEGPPPRFRGMGPAAVDKAIHAKSPSAGTGEGSTRR